MQQTVEPLTFELKVRRESYGILGTSLVRDQDRDARLPKVPPGFRPLRGDWQTVHDEAVRLNRTQERSGHLDFFFFPEVADAPDMVDPTHCDACGRISKRRYSA